MKSVFKRTVLGAAVSSMLLGMAAYSTGAMAADDVASGDTSIAGEGVVEKPYEGGFFEDAAINGAINLWMRDRTRAGTNTTDGRNGKDTAKNTNLDHGTIYAALDFKSGYIGDVAGLDLNVYTTFDMWNNGSPDHEMNFWNVNNPYDTDPGTRTGCTGTWDSSCTDNGGAFQTAAAKFKFGEHITARGGYFQPSVPSTLGVNWSYAAGTYEGGEAGATFGPVKLGFAFVDKYRAPWYKKQYNFRTGTGPTAKNAGNIYSLGMRYSINDAMLLDVAYAGMTEGDRKNAHVKFKWTTDGGWYVSPQVYVVDDDNQYDKTAFQLAFLSAKSFGQYNLRLESTYTSADSEDTRHNVGNLAYRMTEAYGGSNGAYDIWWNNRSDFNHDGELGFFGELKRDLSDLGAPGLTVGLNGVYAFGAEYEGSDDLVEYSGSAFANYAIQSGALEGATFGIYYTHYVNDSNTADWVVYSNGFNDENDLKVTLTVPFGIK
ncbi:multidrug transporter [Vibrio sp. S11_S32]|uniref:multidrug transporter n=1 Tax=Vibrio sp. S11_S32 TaxID=2720225 RepID=UPI001680AF9C|nr:multidrug transporter [Vibrio sp. S11_S32]MBD1574990.1 multidrug transporter [Vibrio sp. S11_S32]